MDFACNFYLNIKERDLKRIYLKLKVVIVPYLTDDKIKELKQCKNFI